MKRTRRNCCVIAGVLALLLCGCSRVRVPQEELRPVDRPIQGITETPTPDPRPDTDTRPKPSAVPLLEEGLCALLPGAEGESVLYDRYGSVIATIPGENPEWAGVYPVNSIVAGYRLSDGTAVLPRVSSEAEWVQDAAGFSVCDRQAGLLYRLDASGKLLFSCVVPAAATYVSLLPIGRNFLVSLWSGCGTDTDPWRMQAPCVLLNSSGKVERDLSGQITAPVVGILGDELLLLACQDGNLNDAYDLDGTCLSNGLLPLPPQGGQQALGGVLCDAVWKDGWICSAGLQPQQPCPDPRGLQICGDHISGVTYDIDGISSNGQLLFCGAEAAVWAVEQGVLAIQWQGINYHFDAGKYPHQQLQRCGRDLAVSYAWDDNGNSAFRLLFLRTGAILEYDCPPDAKASALLGDGYALLATLRTDSADGSHWRCMVVDAEGALRLESSVPLLPCTTGPYLLCRQETGVAILDLEGKQLLSRKSD